MPTTGATAPPAHQAAAADAAETTLVARIEAGPADRLAAAFDAGDRPFAPGDVLPPGWHWLTFLNVVRASLLSADGRGGADGLLPAFDGLARMWAGCEMEIAEPMRIGETVTRTARATRLDSKQGRSGPLVLASIAQTYTGALGARVSERQDLVFRPLERYAPPATGKRAECQPNWRRCITPDEILLFCFSALTYNPHRIHYDRPYAEHEGYPGLVVHGPLTCLLLLELLRTHSPGARLTSVSCRAQRALFCGQPIVLCGAPRGEGTVELWAEDPQGFIAMTMTAVIA